MKIRLKYIFAMAAAMLAVSCNYLDFDETQNQRTKDEMYSTFANVKNMLTHIYSYMPQPAVFATTTSADLLSLNDCASDDGEFGAVGATIQNVNNGNWSAVNTYNTAWDLYYGIRAANGFLAELVNVDLSRYENIGASYKEWLDQMQYFEYEARVLRAYYFFELARRYGDIAMPLTVLSIDEANTIGKTPFAEVIDFIAAECDECAPNLPIDFETDVINGTTGRVTRGFAMAVKSKALLYAASALHNPSMDTELWRRSAAAAQDIINLGVYSLDPDGCFNKTTSSELVLARMNVASNFMELYNFPLLYVEGNRSAATVAYGNYPSQNLVDAFETVNGYSVKLTAGGWVCDDPEFDPQNPYANRDPRFARTILANGMTFKGRQIAVYSGGTDDALTAQGGTPTGYYLHKFIVDDTSFTAEQTSTFRHHWIIYRYAETLLTYAESMLNAFGSGSYKNSEFTMSALEALNLVRENAGMPAVGELGKEALMAKIQNEWRVEFAFEDHRFWDVRRWKIGAETQPNLYGVYITRAADGHLTFTQSLCETRTWRDCMYLYPIPQSELFKNSNLYPQNQGW